MGDTDTESVVRSQRKQKKKKRVKKEEVRLEENERDREMRCNKKKARVSNIITLFATDRLIAK